MKGDFENCDKVELLILNCVRGFDNSWIDRQMDIGDSRVAFASKNIL